MPAETADRVGKRVTRLKSKLKADGASMSADVRRKAAKRVRRAQRKFHRLNVPIAAAAKAAEAAKAAAAE